MLYQFFLMTILKSMEHKVMNRSSAGPGLFLLRTRKRVQSNFIDVTAITIPEISLLRKLKTGKAQ